MSSMVTYNTFPADIWQQDNEARIEGAEGNDERLDLAIQAVELAMKAIKLAPNGREKESMKAKASELLQQAERFKNAKNGIGTQSPRTRTPTATPSISSDHTTRAFESRTDTPHARIEGQWLQVPTIWSCTECS
jgi:hypothetical protein